MKRWKTCESLAVEDYFEDITQPIRWRSVEKLEKISVDLFENISQVQQIPKEDKGVLNHSYLVCAICKQFFSTPKLLRCLHSFCKSCLESLVTNVTDTEDIVVCAICSATSKLGSQGVKALPVNFLVLSGLKHLNYAVQERKAPIMCGNCEDLAQATGRCDECAEFLCEKCTAAHRRVRVTREHEIIPLNEIRTSAEVNNNLNEPDNCLAHKGEELTYYCQTCDELICRECTVVNHPKKSHAFELLKDASTKHRQEIWSLLRSIKMRTPFVKRALLEIEEACRDIPEHANAIEEQIRNLTVRYIRALKDREAQLLDELGAMKEYKATLLEQQKDRLHKGIKDIESNCGLIEKMSREGTAVEVARVKNFISERLRNLEDKLQDMSPLEGPEFDYVTEEELLFDVINRGGKVKSSTKPPAVRLIGEGLYNATVGKTSSFVLALRQNTTITKDQIEVRIETPDLVILTCNITEHNSQLSLLTYTPKIHGQHVIAVLANGENVEESPYTVYVKKGHMNFAKKSLPVCLRFGYKGCGRGELNNPSGVAVDSSGVIAVSDTLNDRVQLFSCRGAFIRQFGSTGDDVGKLRSPIGLCFSRDGQIVVADRGNNRIQVFNPEGVLVRVILCAERSLGAIKNPTGVAVDEEGQVLVTDQQNHRVVIFNSHGAYCHQFGSLGIKDGEFNNPSYITLNQDGEIFVTDTSNHRVQIFNSSGRFLRKFGRPGTADGQFHYPVGITVDSSGYVFVSDRTNRVQVFNSHLRFVTKFGGKLSGDGQLSNPQGVDYTPEGRLVVADTGNNSVKVFYFPNE